MNRQQRRQAAKTKNEGAPVTFEQVAAPLMLLRRYLELFESNTPSLKVIAPVPAFVREAEAASSLKCPTKVPAGYVYLKAGKGEPLNCLGNTWARMKDDPTLTYQLGLTMWVNVTRTHLEAHCVIKHPDGTLEDVTSYCDGGKRIAFTPISRDKLGMAL